MKYNAKYLLMIVASILVIIPILDNSYLTISTFLMIFVAVWYCLKYFPAGIRQKKEQQFFTSKKKIILLNLLVFLFY